VNVIAKPLFPDTITASPTGRSPTAFEQLHGLELSGASAWHATERAARAGR